MRALVAGGAGFLGCNLTRRLLEKGYNVTVLDDLSSGHRRNLPNSAKFVEHDIRRPLESLAELSDDFRQKAFDIIFHFASPASPQQYRRDRLFTLETISIGTLNLLKFAQQCGARFVLASSSEVYGTPDIHPQHESYRGSVDMLSERAVYAESKRFAETLTDNFRRDGLDTLILRFFNVYGPGMWPGDGRLVPNLVQAAMNGCPMPIHGSGEQTRSLIWVDEAIDAVIDLLDFDTHGPINIGSEEEVAVMDVARMIEKLIPKSNGIALFDLDQDEPMRRRPDISLLRSLTGHSPEIDLQKGLELFIDWARKSWPGGA